MASNPFKPGDVVTCIDASGCRDSLELHKEYTVAASPLGHNDDLVELQGMSCGMLYHCRFELKTQNQMQNLTVTKERVLEAASKCSTAKATLQLLFPEAFKPVYPLEVGDIYKGPDIANMLLLQVAWKEDKYILVGDVPDLCFSNKQHTQGMTKAEIETYLTNNSMTFSHNIKADIRKLIG